MRRSDYVGFCQKHALVLLFEFTIFCVMTSSSKKKVVSGTSTLYKSVVSHQIKCWHITGEAEFIDCKSRVESTGE